MPRKFQSYVGKYFTLVLFSGLYFVHNCFSVQAKTNTTFINLKAYTFFFKPHTYVILQPYDMYAYSNAYCNTSGKNLIFKKLYALTVLITRKESRGFYQNIQKFVTSKHFRFAF